MQVGYCKGEILMASTMLDLKCILLGLRLVTTMGVRRLKVKSSSKLAIYNINVEKRLIGDVKTC